MHYVIFYCVIIHYVFSEATNTVLETLTNSTGKHLCWSLFFSLKWFFPQKTFVLHEQDVLLPKFSSHRLTSQTSQKYNRSIAILRRTLPWIFGKWFMKTFKKTFHFATNISIYMGHRHFKVLWSFTLYILKRFVMSLKNSHYAYIPLYMHKSLPTLGNEKEQ